MIPNTSSAGRCHRVFNVVSNPVADDVRGNTDTRTSPVG
jgi:hypothetical protein